MMANHIRSKLSVNDVKLSKLLSWLLRHGAGKVGLSLDDGGFIDLDKILKLDQFRKYSVDDIIRVVELNDKKRFTLRCKGDKNILQIRANQGHSLKVDEEGLLDVLTIHNIPPVIYHGTYFSKIKNIKASGLSRMKRNHIHFTDKFPGEEAVISGIRNSCEIVIVVDAVKAIKDGFKFYISDNDVILCP
ncbi:tRNA 2'-phosphotransferase 1, partial [Stegodyphus mimosarum]